MTTLELFFSATRLEAVLVGILKKTEEPHLESVFWRNQALWAVVATHVFDKKSAGERQDWIWSELNKIEGMSEDLKLLQGITCFDLSEFAERRFLADSEKAIKMFLD